MNLLYINVLKLIIQTNKINYNEVLDQLGRYWRFNVIFYILCFDYVTTFYAWMCLNHDIGKICFRLRKMLKCV